MTMFLGFIFISSVNFLKLKAINSKKTTKKPKKPTLYNASDM